VIGSGPTLKPGPAEGHKTRRGGGKVARTYDDVLDGLCEVARKVIRSAQDAGEESITVAEVRAMFGQLSGRPTALVPAVLRRLKERGEVRDVLMVGKDGIVYLNPKGE